MRIIFLALMALTMSACTSTMNSEVASFYETVPAKGQSFTIAAMDEKKQGGIEFGRYAQLLAEGLEKQGYRYVEAGEADLVVRFDYEVSNGEDRLKVIPDPSYPGAFGWGLGMRWGYYDPFAMPYFYGGMRRDEVIPVTVYTRKLAVSITQDDKVVYETRLASTSRRKDLTAEMPLLVDSLFAGFPGENGQLRTVRLPRSTDQ